LLLSSQNLLSLSVRRVRFTIIFAPLALLQQNIYDFHLKKYILTTLIYKNIDFSEILQG